MGSLWFEAVKFYVYTRDHPPPHVHAQYGENRVILELVDGGGVALARRRDAVRPENMKRADLRKVVRMAIRHEAELRELWRSIHGF